MPESPLSAVSMQLVSEIEVRRLECWHGQDGLLWTLREHLPAIDLVRPYWSEP